MANPSISLQQLSRGTGKAETLPSDLRRKDRPVLQTNTLQLAAGERGGGGGGMDEENKLKALTVPAGWYRLFNLLT